MTRRSRKAIAGPPQALTALTHELLHDWPLLLEEVSRDPSYEKAFSGAPLITVRVATYNAADLLLDRTGQDAALPRSVECRRFSADERVCSVTIFRASS